MIAYESSFFFHGQQDKGTGQVHNRAIFRRCMREQLTEPRIGAAQCLVPCAYYDKEPATGNSYRKAGPPMHLWNINCLPATSAKTSGLAGPLVALIRI